VKRFAFVAITLSMCASLAVAQELPSAPTQNPDAPYRLFNTKNIYTLLKLDTRDGKIWQVQWGDDSHRFTETLNPVALASGGKPGRFTLYPTSNIFTFILLDQESGEAWQVQWGKPEERFVSGIDWQR
jgi:hypothetical protein